MRDYLLFAAAALLLGSATPPPPPLPPPPPEPVQPRLEYASLECVEVQDGICTELALGPIAPPAPEPVIAAPAPEPDPAATVRVVVSIPQQKAYVFRGGDLVATSRVSTGKRGHETPTGTFRILQKKVHHRSNLYANAPMPYMQRLTHGGVALHAGPLPGYPASHGCIRLPWGFARKLYDLTDYSTKVTVTRQRPKSAEAALTLA